MRPIQKAGYHTPSAQERDTLSIPKRSRWRPPRPGPELWSRVRLGTATLLSLLLLGLILLEALPGPVHEWKDGFEEAIAKPGAQIALGAIVLSGLLWCVRTSVLRKRMRDPGPIHLVSLEDGTVAPPAATSVTLQTSGDGPPGTATAVMAPTAPSSASGAPEAPVTRLSMYMRERLTQLRFTVPSAMPGRPTSTDFVELLGSTKLDFKQPLAVVGKLLRLVLPTHAYEIRATLLRRDRAPEFGVSVETTILLGRHTMFGTFWATSWEEALDRATSNIGAIVVPLSRGSKQGAWFDWRGQALDDELYDAYQRFQRHSRERRYEEAMDALYAALRRDPANHHLRLQLGLLQEELALYLDALLTYFSIRQGSQERLQAGASRRERRELKRVELLARYRATVLLGWGERLAEQWVPPLASRAHSRRSQELERVRLQMSPILMQRYSDLRIEGWDREALEFVEGEEPSGIRKLFGPQAESTGGRGSRELEGARVRLLFQLCARHDVRRFLNEYSGRHLRRLGTEISFVGLGVMPAWARVRAQSARHALITPVREQTGRHLRPPPAFVGGRHETAQQWPLEPETIRALWGREYGIDGESPALARLWTSFRSRASRRRLLRALDRSKSFLDHYNAACTFAVALLDEPETEPQSEEEEREADEKVRALAREAVRELELAVHVGGSRKVASQWDWILREDPDLAALRAEQEFLRFESERFPSSQPAPLRPRDIVKLVAARHSAKLCSASAAIRERQWHARAEKGSSTNPHEALVWWEEEIEAWHLVCELAGDHRFWQTRLEVMRQMQRFCAAYSLGGFAVPRPAYLEQPIEASHKGLDSVARREIQHLDRRISLLHQEFEAHDHHRHLEVWREFLERLDVAGKPLDADTTRGLANNRASAWGDLRLAMERRLTAADDLHAATRRLKAAASALAGLPTPLPTYSAATSHRHRLLLVANRTLDGQELRDELLRRGHRGVDFHIVAPTLAMRDHYDTTDTEAEVVQAQERLRDALRWMQSRRLRATGAVGDPNVGMGAVGDELRRSGADEVLVATLPDGRSNWLKHDLVRQVANATGSAVEHLIVDLRVYVEVNEKDVRKKGHDPADVLRRTQAYLSGAAGFRLFERRKGHLAIGVTQSPEHLAVQLRSMLLEELSDLQVKTPVIVKTSPPPGAVPAARIARVSPTNEPPGRWRRWTTAQRARASGENGTDGGEPHGRRAIRAFHP